MIANEDSSLVERILELKKENKLNGGAVAVSVMANAGFDEAMRKAGVKVVKPLWETGM